MKTLKASRVEKCTTRFFSKPVFIEDVMQETLHELTAPCDAIVHGVAIRLPVGAVVAIIGGGSGGAIGSMMSVVEFIDNGKTYKTTVGMQIRIPTYA